jgi:hypothetical protein
LFYLIPNNGVMAVSTSVLLPATIASFNGKLVNNTVTLNWATNNEINNLGFDVERSDDGVQFSKIGFVSSKSSSGNSVASTQYSFNDKKIF